MSGRSLGVDGGTLSEEQHNGSRFWLGYLAELMVEDHEDDEVRLELLEFRLCIACLREEGGEPRLLGGGFCVSMSVTDVNILRFTCSAVKPRTFLLFRTNCVAMGRQKRPDLLRSEDVSRCSSGNCGSDADGLP